MVFSGEFEVSVDRNNRVKLPIPFQKGFGQRFYITGLKVWSSLALFPESYFDQMLNRLEGQASPLDPVFIHVLPQLGASSYEVPVDGRGRFTIPSKLQPFVSSAMVFVGAGQTVRLYQDKIWAKQNGEGNASLQILAARLASGGIDVKENG